MAQESTKDSILTTIGIIDTLETKSGYKINEYFIELTEQQLDSLKGKKVAVTGKQLIVKGIDPNAEVKVQGSVQDRYFILEPKFTIIYTSRDPVIEK